MNYAKLLFSCLFLFPIHDHECRFGCLGHRCRHAQTSVSDWDVESANDAGLLAAEDIVYGDEIRRHDAPNVVILNAIPGSSQVGQQLSSTDLPNFWSVVSYQPMNVAVKVTGNPMESVDNTGVQLFLDGRPVVKNRFKGVRPEIELDAEGQNIKSFMFGFQCPSPGKHILQARYLNKNIWSQLSPPLYFQIPIPTPPEIVSVSDVLTGDLGGPLTTQPVEITGEAMQLKLGKVSEQDLISIYVDGKKIGDERVSIDGCCVTVDIANLLVPGTHDVTVRATPGGWSCSLASQPSEKAMIHYFNEDIYLLKPGLAAFQCDCKSQPKSNCCQEQDSNKADEEKNEAKGILDLNEPEDAKLEFGVERLDAINDPSNSRINDQQVPKAPANITQVRFAGFVGFIGDTATRVQDPVETTAQVIDAAQKAITKADQSKTVAETSSMQAQRQLEDISELVSYAEEAATLAERFSTDAATELARANEAATETAAGDPGIHRSVLAANENARIESVKTANASRLARTAADNAKKQVADQAELPAKNAQELFESAEQNQTAALSHAGNAIALAKDAVQAKANDNMGIEQRKRQQATVEAKRALEAADAVESLAKQIDENTAEVARIKGLIVNETPGIEAHRNSAKNHAALVRDHANVAQQFALQSAASKIRSSQQLSDFNSQRQGVEVSLAQAIRHAKTAGEADRLATGSAAEAEVLTDAANQFRSAAGSANARAAGAKAKSKRADPDYQNALAAFGSATRAFEVVQQSWESALGHAEDTTSHSDQANANLAETRAQVSAAHRFFENAETAMQRALEAANIGKVRSVMVHLKSVQAENVKGQRAASKASIAAEISRQHADQAVKHAADAAASAMTARQYRDAAARHASNAKVAAVAAVAFVPENPSDENSATSPPVTDVPPSQLTTQNRLQPESGKPSDVKCATDSLRKTTLDNVVDQALCEEACAANAAKIAFEEAKAARSRAKANAAERVNIDFEKNDWANAQKRTFYMAASAHFPVREFGAQGQLIEREGAVIYEDMEFTFDENGTYVIKFRISTPDMPTNIQMQFQIQARKNGPWFTLTMPHRRFDPQNDGSRGMHPQEFKGRSEILKRCFGDVCNIRRTGSARFGYGAAGLGNVAGLNK